MSHGLDDLVACEAAPNLEADALAFASASAGVNSTLVAPLFDHMRQKSDRLPDSVARSDLLALVAAVAV